MTEPLKTQKILTGGFAAAMDKAKGVEHEDCGHNDWGYYPPLQEIYILWCRTCGTVKQSIPSEDEMEIIGARYLNPSNASRLAAAEATRDQFAKTIELLTAENLNVLIPRLEAAEAALADLNKHEVFKALETQRRRAETAEAALAVTEKDWLEVRDQRDAAEAALSEANAELARLHQLEEMLAEQFDEAAAPVRFKNFVPRAVLEVALSEARSALERIAEFPVSGHITTRLIEMRALAGVALSRTASAVSPRSKLQNSAETFVTGFTGPRTAARPATETTEAQT